MITFEEKQQNTSPATHFLYAYFKSMYETELQNPEKLLTIWIKI